MRISLTLLCIGCFLTLVQCKFRNTSPHQKPVAGKDSTNTDTLKNITYLVLSPNEMISDIFNNRKNLKINIVNPKQNADKYLNSKNQAMNLGVYIADFAYLNVTESRSNALEYFKLIRNLADKNNIYGCFDEDIFNRIQDNLANNDSLISISQEVYYTMTDILQNSGRPKVLALISGGALIESLYLTVMNVESHTGFEKLAQKSFEQEKILENLTSYIEPFKSDTEIEPVYAQLQALKRIMDKAGRKITPQTIVRDKNNHLEVRGGEEITVTEKTFTEFKNQVIAIRNDIVSVSN